MVKTKKKATGGENGNHLTIHRYDDGTVDMKWNWDALLEEVRAATAGVKVTKKSLVKETEAKVTKTRAKKAEKELTPKVKAKAATGKKKLTKNKE